MSKFYENLRTNAAIQVKQVSRLKACRFTLSIDTFINSSRTCLDCSGTINDIENAFWELNIDWGHWRNASENWSECEDHAREWLRKQCPNMPARVAADYDDELMNDAARAVDDTERDEYCSGFNEYLVSGIVDSIDASMPAGARWAWSDSQGNATAEYYECAHIVVAMPHRLANDRNAAWYEYQARDMDAADALQEFIAENITDAIRPEDYDDRGCRGGSSDGWQDRIGECESQAVDTWNRADQAMRKKLRGMIAGRAPLELRAALVANVYGEP